MKLSKRGVYALRVLRHLAEGYGGEPLSAAHLAGVEGVPAKYLEQVLSTLRKRGVLVSARGKQGGYSLRVPPGEITLGDIVRAVDGPLAPIPCASRTAPHADPDCPYPYDECWLRLLMLRVRDNISAVLDRETLAQMASEARGATRSRAKRGVKGDAKKSAKRSAKRARGRARGRARRGARREGTRPPARGRRLHFSGYIPQVQSDMR